MQDLLNRKAGLSEARRALLEKRLRGEAPSARPREVITRCAGPGPEHPMSFAQERMWFVTQLEPNKAVYHVPVAWLIRASIDVPTLERAVTEVVRRHEALRTVFGVVDGELRQIVRPPAPVKVEVFDVREEAAGGSDALRRLVSREAGRPIDITTGPMLRVTLLRESEERYAMVTTVHHIATDGWAMPLVIREVDEIYAAFLEGRPTPCPEPALRYADYAVWQRRFLQGETLEKQLRFWREHLDGAPDTEVPGDRPRPPQQSFRGTSHRFVVPPATVHGVRELCRTDGVTVNMVLMAAFAAVLGRYAGDDRVTIGSLFGNRSRSELEEIFGYFVNTAAVHADLRGDPPFRRLVKQMRGAVLDGDAHQDVPFEMVVDHLVKERDPSRNPLFQVMYFHHTFVEVHRSSADSMLSALDPQPLYPENTISLVDTGVSKFDMTMCTIEFGDGLIGLVEYSTDLYDPATIERFSRSLVALLADAVSGPDRPVSHLSLVPPEERADVLRAAAGPSPAISPAPFGRLFAEQARRTPAAAALLGDGGETTYGELDAASSRLAHRLRARGVGPETVVGVALERSPELVETILAVAKAGGAFLPLDPAYPRERLRWMLKDSGARLLVSRGALAGELSTDGVASADVERLRAEAASAPADAPEVAVDAENAAYVIYTSGSTGTPKGVVVPHRGIGNLAAEQARAFGIRPGSRVLQFAALSFDAAVAEIAHTLLAGGTLVIPGAEATRPGPELLALLADAQVNVVTLPPSVLGALAPDPLPALETVVSAGEAVAPDVAERWGRGRRFVNAYGPTETTVCATVAVDPPAAGRVAIGGPLAGVRTYVVDQSGDAVPASVPGELAVGGIGVARGYLGRPGLTAERFVPDPFSGVPGARLYRTGDRARRRHDGLLEFLGRADAQVKVRGHRVEPGEVEAALAAHPAVRQAAVVLRQGGGHARLVAYAAAEGTDAAELRAHLAGRLPQYMLPSAMVVMDALPLTPSGKLDRRALPAPEPQAPASAPSSPSDAAGGEPRNAVEEALARIWREVLKVDRIGVNDDFYEIGGDSILSIRVIARAAREGIRLTARQVFELHTVAELAAVAGTEGAAAAEQGPVTGTAPLTPVQRWFLASDFDEPDRWNMSAVLAFDARVEADAVRRAWAALARHHDALRARLGAGEDGEPAVVYDAPGEAAFDTIDLSIVPDEHFAAELDAAIDRAQGSLDLHAGPAARAVLIECGAHRPQRLFLAVHHLAVDAVSWAVLGEDLEAALRQAVRGEAVSLPPKTTSFREWAVRLAAHAASPQAQAEAAYWISAVPADAPALAPDPPDAEDTEGATRHVFVQLDAEETRALLQDVPAAYGTQANDALLAALSIAWTEAEGDGGLLVDLEGHGREDLFEGVDLSRTVGWFTSQHPLLLPSARADAPGQALREVKERLRAVPRHGIGFGVLRWMGGPAAEALAALPSPSVAFNYLGQMAGGADEGDSPALMRAADEQAVHGRSPCARRTHRLSIEAGAAEGWLRVGFFHGPSLDADRVRRLAEAYGRALRLLIAHCRDADAGGFTPSDFPEAGLDQASLDALLAQLGG